MYSYLSAQQCTPASHITSPGELSVSQWGQESLSVPAREPFWEIQGIHPHLNALHCCNKHFVQELSSRDICEDPPLHTNAPIHFHPTHLTKPQLVPANATALWPDLCPDLPAKASTKLSFPSCSRLVGNGVTAY